MRSILVTLALLVGGCAAPAASNDAADSATGADVRAVPFAAEGRVWLPPSQGQSREETLIPFLVNQSGMSIAVDLALGSTYGPADLPETIGDVVVEIRAPDGSVLADASMTTGARDAHLDAVANATGEHALAILSYGGSDGAANGDHVDWRIAVEPQLAAAPTPSRALSVS